MSVDKNQISDNIFNNLMSMLDDIENRVMKYNGDNIKITAKRHTGKIRQIANRQAEKVVSMDKARKSVYTEKRRELAKIVSEKARVANKRLARLEKNGLEKHSAYLAWAKDGKIRFSVKGKSYQQLQREYWRVQKFLDSETSTIKGAKQNMQNIMTKVLSFDKEDVNNMSLDTLKQYTSNFFKIRDRIEELYRDEGQSAKAIDYQKIMNEIEEWTKKSGDMLLGLDEDIGDIDRYAEMIKQYMELENKDITDEVIGW